MCDKNWRRGLALLLILILLAACSPVPAAPLPALPSAQVLTVQISPSLQGLRPQLSSCAQQQGSLGLVINELPGAASGNSFAHIQLRLGSPSQGSPYAAVLGQETLAVVVHPANPIQSITRAQLSALYHGEVQTWGALDTDIASDSLAKEAILPLSYSPGEDLQILLENLIGASVQPSAAAIVPGPLAMRQAVAGNPAALGLLPARLVDSSVRTLALPDWPAGQLQQPILALLDAEPQGAVRSWLACVQKELQP